MFSAVEAVADVEFFTLHSALSTLHFLPRTYDVDFDVKPYTKLGTPASPVKNFTNVSVFAKVALTSSATPQKPLQKAQNAIKFRSKKVKSDQKGPSFVLPILTF